MREIVRESPVIAIMRNVPDEDLLFYANACVQGGITALEITLNSDNALKQIETLKNHFGGKAQIGAGTVLSPEKARDAVNAGADFMLTPNVDEDVLNYCKENKIKLLPGVMTPSDVGTCLKYGFDILKLFPAGELPAGYIKALKGPFETTDYLAVGGVTLENADIFMKSGYKGIGVGGALLPKEFIKNGDLKKAAERVKKFTEKVKFYENY